MSDSDDSATRALEAARELGPKIRAAADEIEQGRRLPMHLVREMQRAGVFRMAMPRAWGGPELDFLTQLRVIEALSIADASAGWCTMIGVDGGYMTAYIDQAVAREMYRDLDSVTAITFAPPGKAVKTKDGFIVNGRWPFGSGCQHATWLIGHFLLFDGDSMRVGPNGLPETRFGFLPAEEGEILDTWTTNGLRGSGSHDWTVKDGFIPEERTFNLAAPTLYRQGPLYTLPNLLIYKVSGVGLGIARGAIEDFIAMASNKPLTFKSPSANKTAMLRDESYVQCTIAQAEALVSSARGFVFEAFGDLWNTLAAGDPPSLRQRARGRLAMAHASAACLQAVELLYKANGGSSVYAGNLFDRRLRDMQTANQHTVVSLKTWEVTGRVLLGLEHNYGLLF
ncbi:MAG TPA: acyl-CoA dehydrogenase family protein [Candidatus Binataceae bacterium]|jgi:alkylation response protein AidB-like acyl-CoA dehydrogenase|nr:acyl-CoA dehydrogenase family protein [Candidatus Binataceae bacterium]